MFLSYKLPALVLVVAVCRASWSTLQREPVRHVLALLHGKAGGYTREVEFARRTLDKANAELRKELDDVERTLFEFRGTFIGINEFFDTWTSNLRKRMRIIERTAGQTDVKQVAFQARLSPVQDEGAGDHQWVSGRPVGGAITFPDCTVNIHGAYDKNTGKFQAPVDGFYLLAVRVSTWYKKGAAILEIVRRAPEANHTTTLARAETLSLRQDRDAVLAVTVTRLTRGDSVYVVSGLSSTVRVFQGGATWFMGAMLNTRIEVPRVMLRSLF